MAHLTEIVRPSGNGNALWSTNTYTAIDDVVQSPTAGDGTSIVAGQTDSNERQEYQMSNPSGNYSSIDGYSLWFRAIDDSTTNKDFSIYTSGNWAPDVTFGITNTYNWYKVDFTPVGNPTISDISDMKILFDAGSIVGKNDEFQIDVAYVVVSGVAAEGGGGGSPATTYFPKVNNGIFDSPVVIGL